MHILAINGSPRGDSGHTAFLLKHFLDGAASAGATIDTVSLAREKIHPCTGEFHCWLNGTGTCLWDGKKGDSMHALRMKIAAAENLVLATPVYADGMTGQMKTMLDRCLPNLQPYVELDANGEFRHPPRHGTPGKKIVLLSTCGFPEIATFDPLILHVERLARNMGSRLVGRILRPNTFVLPFREFLGDSAEAVLAAIGRAGGEYANEGGISPETEAAIAAELVPKEMFADAARMFWETAIAKGGFKKL